MARRTSAPNLKLCDPETLLKLSDHCKVFPTCGSSPSKSLPIVKADESLIKGTPSWLGPRPGVIPSFGSGVKIPGTSKVPLKQKFFAVPVQESVTLLVRAG